jgi:hypothetical protein
MTDRGPAPDSNPRKVPETIDGSSGDAIADEPGSPTRGRGRAPMSDRPWETLTAGTPFA